MKVFPLTLLLLLALCGSAQAQDFAVRVRVQHENSPVPRVSVTLGVRNLISNEQGEALFRVPAGRYQLRVEQLSYRSVNDTVLITADTLLAIELEESALEVEEIIVTSTRGERRVQDEPVKVEVVTREEVEEKLLMTPGSIAMLLNETSGLRVQETSPALGGAVIRVQGLRGRYTQLLSDGLPVYGGQAGSLGILQIPPMDLAQVEVIKGAASALYGASALGGAINLISRRPADESEVMLNQTTRSGTDVVIWNANEINDRIGYTTLLSGHSQQSQDVDDDGWADLPRYRRVVARPRLFLNGAKGSRAMVTLGAMLENRRGGGAVPGGSQFTQRLDTRRFDVGFSARTPISEQLQLDVRGSGAVTDHIHQFGETRESDDHSTGFVEASLRGLAGRHYWLFGAALQRDGYSGDLEDFDYVHWVRSLFAQDEISFSNRLAGSLSLRADWHNEYGTFLAPRASALLRLTDFTSVRLSAGGGYYGPTPFTEETEEVGLSNVHEPAGLVAERAEILSADFNWSVSPFEVNLSVFGSRIRNAVQTIERGGKLDVVNVEGSTRTRGFEVLGRSRSEPFGVTAAYTFVRATQPTSNDDREDVPLMPRHSASLVAVYEKHGSGRAGIEMYYTGAQTLDEDPYRSRSEPYFIIGLLVERRFGRVRAFLNMENLTNVRQSNYQSIVRPARTLYGRWTTDVWAPVDGRTFNGGVRVMID